MADRRRAVLLVALAVLAARGCRAELRRELRAAPDCSTRDGARRAATAARLRLGMKRLARLGFVASLALAAVAAPSYADWTANPSSGPPGTVVTVNVVPCEGPTTFMLSFIRGHQSLGPTVPFTPPTGTIVVPDVPDGEYGIFVNCGAGESFVPFAVRATPGFTG